MVSFGTYNNTTNQTGKWHHFCGGAILSKFCIITASHCFFGPGDFFTHTKIRIGDQNFTDSTDNLLAKTYEIRTMIKHPDYISGAPRNDLVLVFTKTEIEFNVKSSPINLPTTSNPILDLQNNQTSKFSGWGWFNGSKIVSEALRATNFTIFTGEYCEKLFTSAGVRNHLENTTIMYCSGTDVSCTIFRTVSQS